MAMRSACWSPLTVASEFYRGGRGHSSTTGQACSASMVQFTHATRAAMAIHRPLRVVVVIIGFAGAPSISTKSGDGIRRQDDHRSLHSDLPLLPRNDDSPNYASEWAVLDVYKGGKQIDTMTPVRRFYKASQQTSTMPDIRSSLNEDLYLVFEGLNQDNGHPILKAHLNALVMWIWMGVVDHARRNDSSFDSECARRRFAFRPRNGWSEHRLLPWLQEADARGVSGVRS